VGADSTQGGVPALDLDVSKLLKSDHGHGDRGKSNVGVGSFVRSALAKGNRAS